jgi:hypothetical protein
MSHLPFDRLSFSSINAFAGYFGCELAWAYDRIDRLPKRPKGPGMLVGTAWDHACSGAARTKLEGKQPEPGAAAETFLQTLRNPPPDEDYDLTSSDERKEEVQRAKDRGPSVAAEFVAGPMQTIRPVAVQRRVEIAFDEVPWTLVGYVDLVEQAEKGGEILGVLPIDHKSTLSSNRKFDDEKAQTDLQLGLYDFALHQEGEHVIGRGWRWMRLLKTKHDLGLGVAPSNDATRDATLNLLAGVSQRIEEACETGNFLPTARLSGSYKCQAKYCDFYNRCPHGRAARTVVAIGGSAAEEAA